MATYFSYLVYAVLVALVVIVGGNPTIFHGTGLFQVGPLQNNPHSFIFPRNIQQLSQLLYSQGIDLSKWGKGAAKTVDNLWKEIKTGDSNIQVYPLRRKVEVSVLIIRHKDEVLIEVEQTMGDNRTRQRHWPPSEKIQRGENPRNAAIRCLSEELEIAIGQFSISKKDPIIGYEERDSKSYPGLKSDYKFYLFEVVLHETPQAPFRTREQLNDLSDPVKTHLWTWAPPPPLIAKFLTQANRQE